MSTPTTLRRLIHPEIRVLDAKRGLVEYVASDETLDSYREAIRAAGWKFNLFKKNSPFVDSHDTETIARCVGGIVDFYVSGTRMINIAQWAIDVEENTLAKLGFRMTQAGYLKAVSVGFRPLRMAFPHGDPKLWEEALKLLAMDAATASQTRAIHLEQEQLELSACILGANPNAVARAYKAEVIGDADLEFISRELSAGQTKATSPAHETPQAAAVSRAQERQRRDAEFLRKLEHLIKNQ